MYEVAQRVGMGRVRVVSGGVLHNYRRGSWEEVAQVRRVALRKAVTGRSTIGYKFTASCDEV